MNFATIHEAAQADARKIVRGVIDVTPAGCAARKARIEVAAYDRRVREGEMELAREVYRRHGIRHDAELLQALQSVHANCSDSPYRERLMSLILDMDSEMHEPAPTLADLRRLGMA